MGTGIPPTNRPGMIQTAPINITPNSMSIEQGKGFVVDDEVSPVELADPTQAVGVGVFRHEPFLTRTPEEWVESVRMKLEDLGGEISVEDGYIALKIIDNLRLKEILELEDVIHVRSLDCFGLGTGAEGARAIANSKNLRQLITLSLVDCNIRDEGAQAIANSKNLGNLICLHLRKNNISAVGAKAIANSTNLPKLDSLAIKFNDIDDEGAQAIANSTNLGQFVLLDLWRCNISDVGVKAIAESGNLRLLSWLDLCDNDVSDTGAQAIASSENLRELTWLDLSYNCISYAGARAIANSKNLRGLASLDLEGNNIGAEGVQAIASSPNLPKLTLLRLNCYDSSVAINRWQILRDVRVGEKKAISKLAEYIKGRRGKDTVIYKMLNQYPDNPFLIVALLKIIDGNLKKIGDKMRYQITKNIMNRLKDYMKDVKKPSADWVRFNLSKIDREGIVDQIVSRAYSLLDMDEWLSGHRNVEDFLARIGDDHGIQVLLVMLHLNVEGDFTGLSDEELLSSIPRFNERLVGIQSALDAEQKKLEERFFEDL